MVQTLKDEESGRKRMGGFVIVFYAHSSSSQLSFLFVSLSLTCPLPLPSQHIVSHAASACVKPPFGTKQTLSPRPAPQPTNKPPHFKATSHSHSRSHRRHTRRHNQREVPGMTCGTALRCCVCRPCSGTSSIRTFLRSASCVCAGVRHRKRRRWA